jgi:hypothetical protein
MRTQREREREKQTNISGTPSGIFFKLSRMISVICFVSDAKQFVNFYIFCRFVKKFTSNTRPGTITFKFEKISNLCSKQANAEFALVGYVNRS